MDITNETVQNEIKISANNLEHVCGNCEDDFTDFAIKATGDESLENMEPKNPMLISPVIRCVLKYLNIDDIKNSRLVSREWGSTGKLALAKRALIHFFYDQQRDTVCRPVDFYSCFLDSAPLFSAFKIFEGFNEYNLEPWTIEELKAFFDKQQKYIKELTLNLQIHHLDENFVKNIHLSSWISKSPMVQKDAKHMTKLSITGNKFFLDIPLHLIVHIKDLTLCNCRIHLEEGIKICSVKLKLERTTFFQNGIQLNNVRINDIVELCKTKEVILDGWQLPREIKYVVDFWGSATLGTLRLLKGVQIINGSRSMWDMEHVELIYVPYSLNSQMRVKELSLSNVGNFDLYTLPTSIQKLYLHDFYTLDSMGPRVSCSQPTEFANLQYLIVSCDSYSADFSFLHYFLNCPQLKFLKLVGYGTRTIHFLSFGIPKNIKTLMLQHSPINWEDKRCLTLDKLILYGCEAAIAQLYKAKIQVDDLVIHQWYLTVDDDLISFLEYRNNFRFDNRLYIGQLNWGETQLEDSFLKDHVDVKSSFYVFENGEKGRAISRNAFHDTILNH